MLRSIILPSLNAIPASFPSVYDVERSIARLAQATEALPLRHLQTSRLGGVVDKRHVCLRRHIPLRTNVFQPHFIGDFEEIDGKVVLRGNFALHWRAKLGLVCWLTLCSAVTVSSLVEVLSGRPNGWAAPLIGIALMVGSLLMALIGRYAARDDVEWLSTVISSRLSGTRPVIAGSEVPALAPAIPAVFAEARPAIIPTPLARHEQDGPKPQGPVGVAAAQ